MGVTRPEGCQGYYSISRSPLIVSYPSNLCPETAPHQFLGRRRSWLAGVCVCVCVFTVHAAPLLLLLPPTLLSRIHFLANIFCGLKITYPDYSILARLAVRNIAPPHTRCSIPCNDFLAIFLHSSVLGGIEMNARLRRASCFPGVPDHLLALLVFSVLM